MRIIASANNPGGANAILPLVKKFIAARHEVLCILEDKAREIFQSAGLAFVDANLVDFAEINKLVSAQKFDLFLAGTSLGLTIDKKILAICQANKTLSIYVLDFWSNYWQRFSRQQKDFAYLPDYILIMDDLAQKEMLAEGFPPTKLRLTGNPFFDDFASGIDLTQTKKNLILFVSQPMKDQNAVIGPQIPFDEFQALGDLIELMGSPKLQTHNLELEIRLHPRDEKHKFDGLMENLKFACGYDQLPDVKLSLARAGIIVGISSVVLLQAALAGKYVISYQGKNSDPDPLISNRLGISRLAKTKAELEVLLAEALNNRQKIIAHPPANVLVKDACAKAYALILELIKDYDQK